MKSGLWVTAALFSAALFGASRSADAAQGLTLRRVMLSTGGVGYFEYEAKVSGDARIPLRVRLDQVDDVLKSVIISDDKGNHGEITLPGKDRVRELFRDLPFNQGALDSAAALIGALRGAEVRAELQGGGAARGSIVSVTAETSRLPSGETITRHRLTLQASGKVRQVILEDVQSLKLLDKKLQGQLDQAIDALGAQREQGQRVLSIHIAGEGERVVRVAYVAGAPLWKTTYRLTLPEDARAATARIEGLAVVENRSGKDWRDIDLTLLSGNPVTFRQALYEAYYVVRPEVAVDMVKRVLPSVDVGAIAAAPPPAHALAARRHGGSLVTFNGGSEPSGSGEEGEGATMEKKSEETTVKSEAPTQVIFRFKNPVTIADGQSALLPVINHELPAARWSLYQPETDPQSPLSTIRLTNNSQTDLPPGVMSIYERASVAGLLTYVGDARLSPLPIGESRTVSYAVDQRVKIHKDEKKDKPSTTVKIVNGMLTLTRVERQTTTYAIAGAAHEPRTMVIEQPIRSDWKLGVVQNAKLLETTADRYRFETELAAGDKVEVSVTLEHAEPEIVRLSDLSDDQIGLWIASSELTPAAREAIVRVAALRTAVAGRQAALSGLEAEQKRLTEDEARIRENLKVLPAGSDLYKSALSALSEDESRLRALVGEISAARDAVARAKQELTTYVSGLNINP